MDNPLDMPVPLHHLFQLGGVKDDGRQISRHRVVRLGKQIDDLCGIRVHMRMTDAALQLHDLDAPNGLLLR